MVFIKKTKNSFVLTDERPVLLMDDKVTVASFTINALQKGVDQIL
jgi:hypothetical protein